MTITDLGTVVPTNVSSGKYVATYGVDSPDGIVKYLAPPPSGTAWHLSGFDDSGWSSGLMTISSEAGAPSAWITGPNQMAVRKLLSTNPGFGYLRLGADDSARFYIGGVEKVYKMSPASERWYSFTSDEWTSRQIAILATDDLGGQRSIYWAYYLSKVSPFLRQRQHAV